jgi:DNA-binding PadR family transcriptional regulator
MRSYTTELECCVLSIVKAHEPCTAYTVRRTLAESASSFWSGSSGSVYPLLRRLEAQGLVATDDEPWGEGSKRLFRLTREGRAELKQWVRDLPDWSGSTTMDAIRTRVFAFEALTDRERRTFVDRAEQLTRASIRRMRDEAAELTAAGKPWEAIGTMGGVRELEARLRWLREVRDSSK